MRNHHLTAAVALLTAVGVALLIGASRPPEAQAFLMPVAKFNKIMKTIHLAVGEGEDTGDVDGAPIGDDGAEIEDYGPKWPGKIDEIYVGGDGDILICNENKCGGFPVIGGSDGAPLPPGITIPPGVWQPWNWRITNGESADDLSAGSATADAFAEWEATINRYPGGPCKYWQDAENGQLDWEGQE